MKEPIGTNLLTESAMLLGVFVVLAILTYYTPFFLISIIILPIPYVIIAIRTNIKIFLMSVLVGFLILIMLIDPVFSVTLVLFSGGLGMALGSSIKVGDPSIKTILKGTASMIALILLALVVIQSVLDLHIFTYFRETFQEIISAQTEYFKEFGASTGQISDLKELETMLIENIRVLFPASVITTSVLISFIVYTLNNMVLTRMGYHINSLPPFKDWRFPAFFAAFYIIATFSLLFLEDHTSYMGMLVVNLFNLTNYIFLLQGSAVGYWFLRVKKNVPKWISIILILLVIIIPPMSMLVVLLGLSDQFINYRKINMQE